MNISFFLQPKCKVAYIYNDDTIRQGLQKMNYYGYSAIPVLDENEHYVGTIMKVISFGIYAELNRITRWKLI